MCIFLLFRRFSNWPTQIALEVSLSSSGLLSCHELVIRILLTFEGGEGLEPPESGEPSCFIPEPRDQLVVYVDPWCLYSAFGLSHLSLNSLDYFSVSVCSSVRVEIVSQKRAHRSSEHFVLRVLNRNINKVCVSCVIL